MLLAASPLIEVVPGLMIWTLVCFAITFFVLKKFAFGPIQKTIDERRDRIPVVRRGGRRTPAARRARCSRSTSS
jgi:hypothetical protein